MIICNETRFGLKIETLFLKFFTKQYFLKTVDPNLLKMYNYEKSFA